MTTKRDFQLQLDITLDEKNGDFLTQLLHLGWSLEYNLPKTSCDPILYKVDVDCYDIPDYKLSLLELVQSVEEKIASRKQKS